MEENEHRQTPGVRRTPAKKGNKAHTHAYRQTGDMLMDIDENVCWTELVEMAQDKDAWKLRVLGLKLAAKAEKWCEATAAKKRLRKELKKKSARPRLTSTFTFRAKCKIVPAEVDTALARQDKEVISRFLHGENTDRAEMQQQSRMRERQEKLKAKKKRKTDKKKTKKSTAKYFNFSKKQTDIRRYMLLTTTTAPATTNTTTSTPTPTATDHQHYPTLPSTPTKWTAVAIALTPHPLSHHHRSPRRTRIQPQQQQTTNINPHSATTGLQQSCNRHSTTLLQPCQPTPHKHQQPLKQQQNGP